MQILIKKLHYLIIMYVLWTAWEGYDEHLLKVEELRGEIPKMESDIEKKIKEKEQLKQFFQDIEKAKDRIELVAQEVEKLQKQFPSEISDTENLDLMANISEGLNIKEVTLSPGREEDKGFYYVKKYQYKAIGTFLQFLIFFEKIAENQRLLNIKSVQLIQSDKKQKGRFQIVNAILEIEAYRYNSNYKESRGIEEIDMKFKAGEKAVKKSKKGSAAKSEGDE